MNFYDGLTPTYTFRLQIERSDQSVLDTEIVVKETQDEVTKAKKNLQRLLVDFSPTIKIPKAPATLEPDAQDHAVEPKD